MIREIRDYWVEELRSGRWEQGRFGLCTNGKYCCFGVLAEITGYLRDSNDKYPAKVCVGRTGAIWKELLPSTLLSTFGISTGAQAVLVGKNDCGVPFTEIADYIEQHL